MNFQEFEDLIHSGVKEIKLDSNVHLKNRIAIDVDDLIIDGCGNTIEDVSKTGIFEIVSDNVTLKNILFSKSDNYAYGGGICNNGRNLKIIDCIFQNNVSINYGGAVFNQEGSIHIENTVFKKNTADYDGCGGAIRNHNGKIVLLGCDFIENISGRFGGAIYNENGYLRVSDCNFSYNSTSYRGKSCFHIAGAIFNDFGTVDIENSNFESSNGEDIYNNWRLNIFNSKLSGDVLNRGLMSINGCQFKKEAFIRNSAILHIFKSEKEYLNNFYKNNSEILFTKYMQMGTGKIRYFDDLNKKIDNGFNYLNDLINSNHDDCFEILLDKDIINSDGFEKGIEIRDNKLIIDGNNHIIDANRNSVIFNIYSSTVILRNIIFKNSFSSNFAPIESLNSHITFENCIFESNDSLGQGGCIHIKNSSLKAFDCKFIDNFSNNGGAIHAEDSSIKLNSCDFIKNNVMGDGGVISLDNCDLISSKSKFNDNVANVAAVIDSYNSILRVCNCEFNNNSALDKGGVIYQSCSLVKFDDCNFKNNKAECSSIASNDKYCPVDNIFFKNSKFDNNQSYENLILMDGESRNLCPKLFLRECIFENNFSCSGELIKASNLYLSSTNFKNNKSDNELIKVKKLFIGEKDMHFKDMVNANYVIEGMDINLKEKELTDEITEKVYKNKTPKIIYKLFGF